jgi:uncharacterized phage-associated protein
MQLQKLLYYAQAWHLAITDKPLFPEQVKAWVDGPVVPTVWHARREPSTRRALPSDAASVDLDQMTSDLVDLVLSEYGSLTGDQLSALTHTETPWLEARAGVSPDQPSTEPISTDAMAAFYRSSRRLGGRTAADLAAGGIHLRNASVKVTPLDIDAFLDAVEDDFDDAGDRFGGANLEATPDLTPNTRTTSQRYFSEA